jgi:methylated-DNA-[protein]-cysteine S-methyltransferase
VRRTWTQPTPVGDLVVVAGPRGIEAIAWGDQRPDCAVGAVPERDEVLAEQLDRWFRGEIDGAEVDVDLSSLAGFRREVLETLRREVGRGETVSYGELAAMAGRPGAARAVGTIMAGNPVPFVVPCHRVVAAGGRIGGYGGTAETASSNVDLKRTLLRREGVAVKG